MRQSIRKYSWTAVCDSQFENTPVYLDWKKGASDHSEVSAFGLDLKKNLGFPFSILIHRNFSNYTWTIFPNTLLRQWVKEIWNTLFFKNMPWIVWLRRSSKSNILKNYITIMLSLVIIYKTSVGQQKIQKLETRYCAALMKLNFPSCLPCWSPSRRWSGDKLRPRIRGQKDVKRNTFIPGKIIITDLD